MPLRTITRPDGTTVTRRITNLHPDGTEFLPEEFTLPYNEQTAPIYKMIADAHFRKMAMDEAEKAKNEKK